MARINTMHELESLIRLSRCVEDRLCNVHGLHETLLHEVRILLTVLQRLQQEASKEGSPLNRRGDVRRKDFVSIFDGCERSLQDCDKILKRLKTSQRKDRGAFSTSIVHPLSSNDRIILDSHQLNIERYTSSLCYILVRVSVDSVGTVRDQIDGTGEVHALRFAVTRITSRLMATGDLASSAMAKTSIDDGSLWGKIHSRLLKEGFAGGFVEQRRKIILAFVLALEQSSAYSIELPASRTGNHSPTHIHHRSEAKDSEGEFTRNHRRKAPSRKRTRSAGKESRKAHCGNGTRETRFVRFADPEVVYGSPTANDYTTPDCVLPEPDCYYPIPGTSSQRYLRQQLEDIDEALDLNYIPRYQALLLQKSSQTPQLVRRYDALIDEMDKQVIDKLDGLQVGADEGLRSLRKKIVRRAQRMLTDLETAKSGLR